MNTPILLIHGLIGTLRVSRILDSFGDCQLLAPDLIGYGESAARRIDDLTLSRQAEHVAEWVRSQVASPVHVVGHSVGGVRDERNGAAGRGASHDARVADVIRGDDTAYSGDRLLRSSWAGVSRAPYASPSSPPR